MPASKVNGDWHAKVRVIDYWGVGFSSIGIMLLLIPISGGGTYFEWNSPMVISMLVLGGISVCEHSEYLTVMCLHRKKVSE